ncbi:MAG: ABC transporter ATP-binding protein [Desulfurococcaceae archaeon]
MSVTGRKLDLVVEAYDVKKYYYIGKTVVKALNGISIVVKRREYVSIMGPSGSGKTTLFNMIGGLDKPNEGKVFIDGVDLAMLDAYELAWLRAKKIGYIFQTFNLIPVLTALENTMLPMIFVGTPYDQAILKARKLLESVGLGDRVFHKPFELSGGQQQRVAIARALANDPSIILADEPTGNLDLTTGKQIINLLKEISMNRGVTVITNTHDLKMIDVSDRVVYLRDGIIERIEERQVVEIRDLIIDIKT